MSTLSPYNLTNTVPICVGACVCARVCVRMHTCVCMRTCVCMCENMCNVGPVSRTLSPGPFVGQGELHMAPTLLSFLGEILHIPAAPW